MTVLLMALVISLLTISSMEAHYTANALLSANNDKIIKSRKLAENVVKRLNLINDPEFNPSLPDASKAINLTLENKSYGTFKNLSLKGVEVKTLKPEIPEKELAQTVTQFLKHLSISRAPDQNAIELNFQSKDPDKSVYILNAVIDEYLAQYTPQNSQSQILADRLDQLRNELALAKKNAEEFFVQNTLSNPPSEEDLKKLNAKLLEAQSNFLDAKIKREQKGKTNTDTSADMLSQKAVLQSEISELSNRYGPKHPKMIEKREALQALERKIATSTQQRRDTLQNDMRVAKENIDQITKDIENANKARQKNRALMNKARELEGKVETAQMILETFLQTYESDLNTEGTPTSETRILSQPALSNQSPSPNKMKCFILATCLSLLAAIAAAVLADKSDKRVRSIKDIEHITNFACNIAIPATQDIGETSITKYVHTNSSSHLTEAIRSLYVELESIKGAPRILTFHSSHQNDGKTTIATLMAAVMAKAGRRVVLIDANLRRPAIANAMRKSAGATLVEYLSGHKALEDVLVRDKETGIDVIFAQSVPNSAFNILSSKKMKSLITALRDQYDLVIIDTPPFTEVADAKMLARLSDRNVYIVNRKNATYDTVQNAMKYFHDIPRGSLEIVLNFAKKK